MNLGARRCDHDPRAPRLQLQCAVPENLPELNRLAMAACPRMFTERRKFPQLGHGRGQRRFLFTSPDRERRSQRVEAHVLVSLSVLLHMDVLSRRSGETQRDGSCNAIDEEQMGRETELSHYRMTRTKADLISAGFLEWHQPIKKFCTCRTRGCEGLPHGLCPAGGERRYRAYPAVLTVTMSFLVALGIPVQKVKELQRGTYEWRKSFPAPMVDILLQRERRRAIAAQERAARATAAAVDSASRIVTASAARVAKLFGKKQE